MALYKIKDFDPDYRTHFDDRDFIGYDIYSGSEKVGSASDLLVDDQGKFRYIVVNMGVWIFGKKVLLPIGRTRFDYDNHRIYVSGMTREQVENLPEYDENQVVDYDQEERVRDVYRPQTTTTTSATMMNAPLDTATPVEAASVGVVKDYDRTSYSYDRDPDLYNIPEQDNQTLRLYEERLVAGATRRKTGEVAVGKHVETETARVAVPVEKERVVIERTPVSGSAATGAVGADAFKEGEVARVEVYEETPDIHKEAVVREEVRIHKEVDRQTVEAQETIRREELDLDAEGNPIIRDSDQR